eukprot:CAMPEP_0174364496 /NCGR_PEP_ID=MMETSP0811_2-20130205/73145_1 /TAXON_ID=73025 ORGANISM="Eutreptiella gymnastica-like, Strain CCMP1594" /NCGR_SAMPLE_ID=MMETSP0811_2 /ASSEMBLY_ACC=CAM_ASM_000667 /LENGTH=165 /DNA_ID=CAMNT_0015504179 /DNA_START=248 /DNA_END=745 /DNA_ORIENTATION=-
MAYAHRSNLFRGNLAPRPLCPLAAAQDAQHALRATAVVGSAMQLQKCVQNRAFFVLPKPRLMEWTFVSLAPTAIFCWGRRCDRVHAAQALRLSSTGASSHTGPQCCHCPNPCASVSNASPSITAPPQPDVRSVMRCHTNLPPTLDPSPCTGQAYTCGVHNLQASG